jgi:hypothetical protein
MKNVITRPKLDAILNGEPIGLGNGVDPQHGINIGENSNRGDNRSYQ